MPSIRCATPCAVVMIMQVLSIWRDAVAHKPQEHAIIEGHNDLCPKSEDDHMAKSRYADATKGRSQDRDVCP